HFHLSLSLLQPPPNTTLFPYTTLFRSNPNPNPKEQHKKPEKLNAQEVPEYWHGPGWYNGVWYDNEDEFLLDKYRNPPPPAPVPGDRKSTRLNSSHVAISYAVFCLKKKT